MSPTAGPPRTRTISAVEPPSSDTGSTYDTFVVSFFTSTVGVLREYVSRR